jgi:DNA-directed RNA polymerase subunit beta'
MAKKVVQVILDAKLPPRFRGRLKSWDQKGVNQFMALVADEAPEEYEKVLQTVFDVGREAVWREGRTLGLDDLVTPFDKKKFLEEMDRELDAAFKKSPSHSEWLKTRDSIWARYNDQLQKNVMTGTKDRRSALHYMVASGARGKPVQMKAMVGATALVADALGRQVPIFGRNSYAEGVRPIEWLASTHGARSSVVSTKRSTARGGYIGKTLTQAGAYVPVTVKDCHTDNGILLDADDPSLYGRVLQGKAAGFESGDIVSQGVLGGILKSGESKVKVRSPLTCQAEHGICAKCAGVKAGGKLYEVGDSAGVTAASAVGEPLAQSALNSKHTSGSISGARSYAGLEYVEQVLAMPENFADGATLSEKDGVVSSVENAPQGGSYVTVDGEQHYIPQGYDLKVKVGDTVEAGQPLSDGLVNPADVTRLRGIGEGRVAWVNTLRQVLGDNGTNADRKNLEILARKTIDHVEIGDEGAGEWLPGDTVSYNRLQNTYRPPDTVKLSPLKDAVGKILWSPALHYTVGTRIRPSMLKNMAAAGIDRVLVDDVEAGWTPAATRLQNASESEEDWLARLSTTYLTSGLQDDALRGRDTNIESNIHYVPRLSVGEKFGDKVRDTGKF